MLKNGLKGARAYLILTKRMHQLNSKALVIVRDLLVLSWVRR